MMIPQFRSQVPLAHADYDEVWFEKLFQAVDHLHDAASTGRLETASPVDPAEMVGWLQDIIYTAQETIFEIRANQSYPK
jgi:hypothetical protein